jgi:hypothetical protein
MTIQMSKARQLPDLTVVEAEILKQKVLDDNDSLTQNAVILEEYICYYCNARVKPIAIGLNNPLTNRPYIRPPHFSLPKDGSHVEADCDYLKQTNNSETDAERRYPEKNPIKTYPNRLSLDWLNLSDDKKSEARNRAHTSHNESSDSNNSNSSNDWAASSILPLVKHFLEPENRHLNLYIHGVNVSTYDKVFERIYFFRNYSRDRLRIYFAQLIYRKISIMNNQYTFFLTDGRFEKDKFTPTIMSTLVIDTSDWSSQDIKRLNEKIADFKDEARTLTNRRELKRGGALPWIFFLGFANSENSSPTLLCDNLRLIELCITKNLNNIPDIRPSDLQSLHDNDRPNKPILKNKNDKLNSDSAESSSQSTDVQEVSESSLDDYEMTQTGDYVEPPIQQQRDVSIFDRQPRTYLEPDNTHESESSQPKEDPLGQMQSSEIYQPIDNAPEEIHRIREMRTRAKQQKKRQGLGKKVWKTVKSVFTGYVKPLIDQLMNFLRGR